MARPMKPLVKSGGFYPSRKWTPLVYRGGYTTANGGEEPAPPPIEKTVTGNPIHILDALAKPAQALSVKLEPIQDLHGYGNPWPAGGGKNLYNADAIPNSSSGGITATVNNGVITLNGTATSNAYFTVSNTGLPVGTYKFSFNNAIANSDVRVSFKNSGGTYFADAGCDTVNKTLGISNGEPALVIIYIRSGAVLTNYVIKPQLEVGTAATDFAPYSNICPISGWTGATVTRTGINVWDEEWEVGGIDIATGNNTTSIRVRSKNYITCVPSASYFWNLPVGSGLAVCYYDAGKNFISGAWEFEKRAKETPSNARYMKFSTGTAYGTTYNHDISINYPAADTTYHAYQGQTYSITFPTSAGTVYGGTLDVTTGKLTVDRAMADLGTKTWHNTTVAGYTRFWASINDIARISSPKIVAPMLCSEYKTETANNTYSGRQGISLQQNAADVYVYDAQREAMSAVDFKAAMSGVQLVYDLATPQTIQLTPTQVELLLGENNLFSDGEMTLVYLADGNASDAEALNILLGGRYVNNHEADEPSDREALDIVLGGKK